MLLGDINVNPDTINVNNNNTPLHTLLFPNCGKPTMPPECNSSGCYKPHNNSKWIFFKKKGLHILHLNINSLLSKINEICFIEKQSNVCIIGISESKPDSVTINSKLDIEDYAI